MPASRTIPLWAANRGIRLMVRTALAQERLESAVVEDLAGLRRMVADRPPAILAASEDLRLAGLDVAGLVREVGEGPAVVILNTSRQPPNPQGTRARFVTVPFTSHDLLTALAPGDHAPPRDDTDLVRADGVPAAAPAARFRHEATPGLEARIADLVRAEVTRQLEELTRATVAEVAHRVVPEMAENLIKQELARLIAETEATAPLDGGPAGDEGSAQTLLTRS